MKYFDLLVSVFEDIKSELGASKFKLILEADFVSRVYYHLLLKDYKRLNNKLYIDTRLKEDVFSENYANKHFDLVIGQYGTSLNKVYIQNPKLVAEFKVFPEGFTAGQLSKRRYHVMKDVDKLDDLYQIYGDKCKLCICLLDDINWLSGQNHGKSISRLDGFILHRDEVNKNISIILIRKDGSDNYVVQIH
jgi:hypothetical protein